MKVVLNTITNYGGASLKPGDIIDIPLNVSQRWINRGIAHECKEVAVIPETVKKIVEEKTISKSADFEDNLKEAGIPFNDYIPSKEEAKIIREHVKGIKVKSKKK